MAKGTKEATKSRTNLSTDLRALPSHHGGSPDPEELDPTPVEIPTAHRLPPTMAEQIAEAVHAQLTARDANQFETPEEADDFEEDDPEVLEMSPYEKYFEETHQEERMPAIQADPEPPPEPQQEEAADQAAG